MNKLSALIAVACLGLFGIAACGQKGPLFLPGNPSEMRPQPPEAEEAPGVDGEEEEADENETEPGQSG